ncbi:hypothetical protein [Nonomuraea sp. NPDC046570]|uniref:hypothetical protein n=1 Tax=Nonomuraea sp. NPDC046570 TaxID=3155255 RepID=UPI0033EBCE2F
MKKDPIAGKLNPLPPSTTTKYGNVAPPRHGGPWKPASNPIGPRVLDLLKGLGRLAVGLTPAIALAGTAIANEPGMAQAASNWKHGISARLDDGVKQLLPQILNTARDGWIARDRDELERAIWLYHREIGALRGVFSDLAGMIDEVAAGYRGYWLKLAGLAIAAMSLLLLAKRMQAMPHPHAKLVGGLTERFVTTSVNSSAAILTLILTSALRAAGEVMTTMLKKHHQFGYIMPSGDAKVDFMHATLDTSAYPSFKEPPPGATVPPGTFTWVEPKVDPKPYGQ